MIRLDNQNIPEKIVTPCTALNIVIAASVSAFVTLGSTILGAGVFTLSLGTIYFRGYLVPGTPTLTKHYFPDRVLQWFDKSPTKSMTDESVEVDPEQILLGAGAVELCHEGTDLCLTPRFRKAWRERIHTVRTHNLGKDHLAGMLDISDDCITIDQHGDAFVVYTEDTVIGQWSSQAAIVADVAAATELSERLPDWSDYAPAEIARVLMSLRIFIEQCPDCDGPVQAEQEAVESCCRAYDVVASACQDCDARLFEIEWDNTDTDESPRQPNQSTQRSA